MTPQSADAGYTADQFQPFLQEFGKAAIDFLQGDFRLMDDLVRSVKLEFSDGTPAVSLESIVARAAIALERIKELEEVEGQAIAAAIKWAFERDGLKRVIATLQAYLDKYKKAIGGARMVAEWACHAGNALSELKDAYERRIRSDCKSVSDLEKEPWRCHEWIVAEEVLRIQPIEAKDTHEGVVT